MKSKEYTTDEGAIVYRIFSLPKAGAPWLVFLPGLAATWRLFEKQIEYFGAAANIFVWDCPSHGDSKDYPLTWSIEDLAHCLTEILKYENIDYPILIGQYCIFIFLEEMYVIESKLSHFLLCGNLVNDFLRIYRWNSNTNKIKQKDSNSS